MSDRRVVITGLGVVTPVGIGAAEFWKNLIDGVSGVDRSPALVKSDCRCKIAGEVKDFHPEQWLSRKDCKRTDRFTQIGLVAAILAAQDAGLVMEQEFPERMGISMGTAYAGWLFATQEYGVFVERGAEAISPYTGTAVFTGSCGGQIALHLGLRAPSITISTGCDCSTAAIAHAADLILKNEADVMFAGGAEAPVHPPIIAALDASYAMTWRNGEPQKASRPFDAKRDGFIMAEGGTVVVIEELNHALKRGARIYAELAGWGSTCDAYHMCEPAPEGEQGARAIRLALTRAGVRPDQVDYVNAHGTSTPRGDRAETFVIKKVFGDYAYNLPVSSIKSAVGHMQGGCGSSEVAACCLSIRDNRLPPTLNYEYPDPECDLDYVPNKSRHHPVEVAVSNSFSFGGRNTAVVLRRYHGETEGNRAV